MKKGVTKAVIFFCCFCVVFLLVQDIIRYKSELDDNIGDRYESYLTEKENSIDIFFIGSSAMYRGIAPAVIWKESGITSFNFGVSRNTAMVSYYQLIYALETQTPKLVIFDFCGIFMDRKADGFYERAYREVAGAITSPILKAKMIMQIERDNYGQDSLTYFFPLLRYHSRWNELTESDFINSISEDFQAYEKGGLFDNHKSTKDIHYDPSLFKIDWDEKSLSEYSWKYYQKALSLCAEKNISVAIVSFPKETTEELIHEYQAIETVCKENRINYYNLNSPAMWEMCGFDTTTDFYDTEHVNSNGTVKISKALAELLQEDFGLPDHRGDPAYSLWDDSWNAFYLAHAEDLTQFGYQ